MTKHQSTGNPHRVITKSLLTFLKSNPVPSIAVIIFITFFLLYTLTAPRTNVSYADSDLLITVGYHLGLAHPPGYALYSLLLYTATHLPLPGTVAFRAHLLSSLLHGLTLSVLFLAINELIGGLLALKKLTPVFSPKLDPLIFGIIGTASLGVSFHFWLYSHIAEKYPLHDFLVACTALIILKLIRTSSSSIKLWLLLGITTGLGIMYHYTFLLLLPAISYLLWRTRTSISILQIRVLIAGFIFSVLISLGLMLALNSTSAPVSWRFTPSFSGLIDQLTRKQVASEIVATGKPRPLFIMNISLEKILNQIPVYAHQVWSDFGLTTSLLIVLGLFSFLWIKHHLVWMSLLLTVPAFAGIPLYLDWPPDLASQAMLIRLFLFGYTLTPLIIALGLFTFLSVIKKHFPQTLIINLCLLIVTVAIIWRSSQIYPRANLQSFDLIHNYYHTVLNQLPENSRLICLSDISCFALLYDQFVTQTRPDITLIPSAYPLVLSQLNHHPELHGFDYPFNPFLLLDYATWDLDHRRTFIIDLHGRYYDYLGLDYGFFYYIPHGYFGELVTTPPSPLPVPDYQLSQAVSRQIFPPQDPMRLQFKASLAYIHTFNARTYRQLDHPQMAQTDLDQAQSLTSQLPDAYQHLPSVDQLPPLHPYGQLSLASTAGPDAIAEAVNHYLQANDLKPAFIGALAGTFRHPESIRLRLLLAEIYEKINDHVMAKVEYQNILHLDPENQTAKSKLNFN